MKDIDVKQSTIDKAQKALENAIKLFQHLESQSCEKAESCQLSAEANAYVTTALGHLMLAKGAATHAVNTAPDVTPQFGGK